MPFKLEGAQDASDSAPAKFKLDGAQDVSDSTADKSQSPGFLDRLQSDLTKRVVDTGMFPINHPGTGQNIALSAPELAIGTAKDLMKNTGESAVNYTPESVKAPIKKVGEAAVYDAKYLGGQILQTDAGKQGLAAAQKGIDAYKKWAEKNPAGAKALESAVDLTAIVPVAKGAKGLAEGAGVLAKEAVSAPIMGKSVAPALKNASQSLAKSAEEQKDKSIWKAIQPKQTAKVKQEMADQEKLSGVSGKKEIEFSQRQKDAVAEAKKIGISNVNSSTRNRIVAKEARQKLAKDLVKKLSESKTPVAHEATVSRVSTALDGLKSEKFMPGDVAEKVDKFKNDVAGVISSTPATPAGLLQARIKLDTIMKQRFGDKVFTDQERNFYKLALRKSRDAMNGLLEETVPGSKDLLKRQSLLYDITDNLRPRAASESETAISRNLERAVGSIPGRNTLEKGVISGLGGTVGLPLTAPAAAGYGAYKAATSPTVKRVASKVLGKAGEVLEHKPSPKLLTERRPMVMEEGKGLRPMTDVEWTHSKDIQDKYEKLGLSTDILRAQDRNTISALEKKYGQSELGKFITQNHNRPIMGRVWEVPQTEYSKEVTDKMLRNSAWDKLDKAQKVQINAQIEKAWNSHKVPIADMILQARKDAAELAKIKGESLNETAMGDALLKAAGSGTSLGNVVQNIK